MTKHALRADTARPPEADRLTPEELLALQLVARGYALWQIADLAGAAGPGIVMALLRRAVEGLGAADAVAEARRRGLIV